MLKQRVVVKGSLEANLKLTPIFAEIRLKEEAKEEDGEREN
jgi:hypothetical protein